MIPTKHKSAKKSTRNDNLASWKDSDESDDPATKLIVKIKNLKQHFIGDYVGRELIRHELFPAYKDIVIVDKGDDIIATLDEIYETLHPQLEKTWLGITRATVDGVKQYKLWTSLPETPIGKHRFQLRTIKITADYIQLQLKVMNEFESSFENSWNEKSYPSFEVNEMSIYHNLCEITKFLAVLFMAIFTIAGNLLWYCGDYSLKIMREISIFLEVMTPIIFGILDFMSKCVGGFYWLIYMLWHSDPKKPPSLPPTLIRSNPQLSIMPKTVSKQKSEITR